MRGKEREEKNVWVLVMITLWFSLILFLFKYGFFHSFLLVSVSLVSFFLCCFRETIVDGEWTSSNEINRTLSLFDNIFLLFRWIFPLFRIFSKSVEACRNWSNVIDSKRIFWKKRDYSRRNNNSSFASKLPQKRIVLRTNSSFPSFDFRFHEKQHHFQRKIPLGFLFLSSFLFLTFFRDLFVVFLLFSPFVDLFSYNNLLVEQKTI